MRRVGDRCHDLVRLACRAQNPELSTFQYPSDPRVQYPHSTLRTLQYLRRDLIRPAETPEHIAAVASINSGTGPVTEIGPKWEQALSRSARHLQSWYNTFAAALGVGH
jgi:hypothetical protein